MAEHDVLTVTQAAAYLDVSRQVIAVAAKRGTIGRKQDALGTRDGFMSLRGTSSTAGMHGSVILVAAQNTIVGH